MRNQPILEKFLIETFTSGIGEHWFRETVSQPIVLSIDVGESQAHKAANELFVSQPQCLRSGGESTVDPIDDNCGITKNLDEWDPHHMGNEEKSP